MIEISEGDRVILKKKYWKFDCVVLSISNDNLARVYVEKFNTYSVSGANVKTWVSRSDLVRDIEYYRNDKLEKLGICI